MGPRHLQEIVDLSFTTGFYSVICNRMQCLMLYAFVLLALGSLSPSLALRCDVSVASPGYFHRQLNSSIPSLTSLHQAAEFAANRLASSDVSSIASSITICIVGKHVLSRPLLIDGSRPTSSRHRHAPFHTPRRVEWVGFDAEVSGAISLLSWTPLAGTNSTFVTKLPPSFAAAVVRNVWAAGHRANRTALAFPETVLGQMTAWNDGVDVGFSTSLDVPEDWISAVSSGAAIELVWPVVIADWMEPRCCIARMSRRNITLARPCGILLLQRNTLHRSLPPPVVIEAVPSLQPEPGCFYHNVAGGLLHYTLLPEDNVDALQSQSFTSSMQALLVISNTSQHAWSNITFTASTWYQPNQPAGYVDLQSCVYFTDDLTGAVAEPSAAISISSSSDISFSSCTFKSLGSPYALSAGSGSTRISVNDCMFSDLSGGAVMFGNILGSHDSITDSMLLLRRSTVAGTGLQYAACAAVFAGYVFATTIESNTFIDSSYSAISAGWGWGLQRWAGYGNVTISRNRMLRVMTRLRDGGAVYVNGFTNPHYRNSIDRNWCDADAATTAVFYLDNGSSNWDAKHNVVTGSPASACFFMTGGGSGDPAANSSVSYMWCSDTAPGLNNCPAEGCVVDNSTVFYLKTGEQLPADAQQIVDGSGAPPRFVD